MKYVAVLFLNIIFLLNTDEIPSSSPMHIPLYINPLIQTKTPSSTTSYMKLLFLQFHLLFFTLKSSSFRWVLFLFRYTFSLLEMSKFFYFTKFNFILVFNASRKLENFPRLHFLRIYIGKFVFVCWKC